MGHELGQAIVVAQVDEQQSAMVALAVNPAGEAHIGDPGRRAAGRRRCGCDRRASEDPQGTWEKGAEGRMAPSPCQAKPAGGSGPV